MCDPDIDRRHRWWPAAALAFGLAISAAPARATLGEAPASIRADADRLGATLQARSQALRVGTAIQVQTMTLADGSTIRQYVSPAGRVFAIGWTMHYKPRLDQLLGSYFAPYVRASREAMHRRPGVVHNAVIETGDLVVESTAHLNAFVGRAVLRSMVTAGEVSDAIR
jgi:Protein of unknown function (DUF2844)